MAAHAPQVKLLTSQRHEVEAKMARRLVILVGVLALAVAACGGDSSSDPADVAPVVAGPGDAAKGKQLFSTTCVSCHGEAGVGIDGLGKPMPGSAFITDTADNDLATFIKIGRRTDDPDNTTGVDMPAKGGNSALTDQDLADLVAYIRTLG